MLRRQNSLSLKSSTMRCGPSLSCGLLPANSAFPSQVCFYPTHVISLLRIVWYEGKFEQLDSEAIDANVNDWAVSLKRLSKNIVV